MEKTPDREAARASWAARLSLRKHGSPEREQCLRAYACDSVVESWFAGAAGIVCCFAKAVHASEVP
eukprot:4610648-Alexandrium_andersonii.AAC.1